MSRPGVLGAEDLERVRSAFGVATEQVRRDHAISYVLAAIATVEDVEDVVFFGGTALSRTLLPWLRLSEDIDLMATASRTAIADQVERAVDARLPRTHGAIEWRPPLGSTRHAESAVLGLDGAIQIRIQLLSSTGYPKWPTALTTLEQRYGDAPPAMLRCLTAPAFSASKAIAWSDRAASRDLYDLWGLATGGHIDGAAADLLRKHGPTSRPDPGRMFAKAPSSKSWSEALGHQCLVQVSPEEALDVVRTAWQRAFGAEVLE